MSNPKIFIFQKAPLNVSGFNQLNARVLRISALLCFAEMHLEHEKKLKWKYDMGHIAQRSEGVRNGFWCSVSRFCRFSSHGKSLTETLSTSN